MNSRPHRTLTDSRLGPCLAAYLGLLGASACFDDPATSLTNNGEEETGDGDGDPGDGDGEPGDGDGEPGDGDGEPGDGDGDGDPGDGDGDGDGDPGDGDGDGDGVCEPNEMECGGGCSDVGIDSSNCGECGNICPAFTLCGEGMCKPEKYAFVTSTPHLGNFGALQADILCADAAATGQLPNGIYRAWISTLNMEPLDWLPVDGVWRLRGDADIVVAYSREQLFSGNLAAPINVNEFGSPVLANVVCNNTVEFPVWTGTSPSGMHLGPDCLGWSSSAGMQMGRIGNAGATDMNWSAAGNCEVSCSTPLPIYCFQQ